MAHQAVPLYSLAQSIVVVRFQQQAIRQVLDKVQVFVSGNSLFSLLRGGSSLIGGAFQVIFEVHGDGPRQKIVHHYNTDILAPCLNTVESIELWQQRALVLVYILEVRRNMEKKVDICRTLERNYCSYSFKPSTLMIIIVIAIINHSY